MNLTLAPIIFVDVPHSPSLPLALLITNNEHDHFGVRVNILTVLIISKAKHQFMCNLVEPRLELKPSQIMKRAHLCALGNTKPLASRRLGESVPGQAQRDNVKTWMVGRRRDQKWEDLASLNETARPCAMFLR